MNNKFKAGQWNATCDVCKFKFKSSELRELWNGLKVCPDDFESRHPSELIKAPNVEIATPWSRPLDPGIFPDYFLLTVEGDTLVTETGDNIIW